MLCIRDESAFILKAGTLFFCVISNCSIFSNTDGFCYSFTGNGGYVKNAGPTVYKMGMTRATRRCAGSPRHIDAPPHRIPLPSPTDTSSELPRSIFTPWGCYLRRGRRLGNGHFVRAAALCPSKAAQEGLRQGLGEWFVFLPAGSRAWGRGEDVSLRGCISETSVWPSQGTHCG